MKYYKSVENINSYIKDNHLEDLLGNITSIKEQDGGFSSYVYRIETSKDVYYMKLSAKHMKANKNKRRNPAVILDEANAYKVVTNILGNNVIPELIYVDPSNYVIIIRAVFNDKGLTLKDQIKKYKQFDLKVAYKCGDILASLHGSAYTKRPLIRNLKRENLFYINLKKWLTLNLSSDSIDISIRSILIKAYAELKKEPKTLIWGDYTTKNIIAFNNNINLIDLENCVIGDPSFDVGLFIGTIILNSTELNDTDNGVKYIKEFLRGYEENLLKTNKTDLLESVRNYYKIFALGWILRRTFLSMIPRHISDEEMIKIRYYINELAFNNKFSF